MKKASELISAMMDSIITNEEDREAVSLFSAWSRLVGVNEAAHSRVEEIENGVVFIRVDHPGWMQKLEMKRSQILKKLQKNYPELSVKAVRFLL